MGGFDSVILLLIAAVSARRGRAEAATGLSRGEAADAELTGRAHHGLRHVNCRPLDSTAISKDRPQLPGEQLAKDGIDWVKGAYQDHVDRVVLYQKWPKMPPRVDYPGWTIVGYQEDERTWPISPDFYEYPGRQDNNPLYPLTTMGMHGKYHDLGWYPLPLYGAKNSLPWFEGMGIPKCHPDGRTEWPKEGGRGGAPKNWPPEEGWPWGASPFGGEFQNIEVYKPRASRAVSVLACGGVAALFVAVLRRTVFRGAGDSRVTPLSAA